MVFSVNTLAFVPFLVVVILSNFHLLALSAPQVPCFFIFGDSLIDNGNNNQLNTKAKANFPPYGIDFDQGRATGRFTNGRNAADFIAELLGFVSPMPPFATAKGNDFVRGVNYASGSAGIREETGEQLGARLSIGKQLENHNVTVSRVSQLLGSTAAKALLNKCLYYFVVGNNDYINNYYIPEYYSTSKNYTTEEYATVLIEQYSQHLQKLYKYGAKKFAVSALGPLGCIPQEVSKGTNGSGCVNSINEAVQSFNHKLKDLVDELSNKLTDAKFAYVGAMDIVPTRLFSLGVKIMNQPCCKVNTTGECIPGSTPCPIRSMYAFYDNFHPTEVIHELVAAAAYLDISKLIIG